MICIKQLPNVITGMRIILSLTLFFLLGQLLAFAVVYFCCGISDVADGFIARRFKLETAIGAKLDSLADFIFFVTVLIVFLTSVHIENEMLSLASITAIAIIRIVNLIMTKQKFQQWGIMHTVANKVTGVVLFLAVPICILKNSIPLWLIITVGIIAIISAIEESAILITTKNYDANKKSFFVNTDHL